jgi:hypothetical protein
MAEEASEAVRSAPRSCIDIVIPTPYVCLEGVPLPDWCTFARGSLTIVGGPLQPSHRLTLRPCAHHN